MIRISKGATVLLATALMWATWFAPSVTAQVRGELGIALGEIPELVTVEDLEGNPVSLADFAGEKPVLFEFWAYWCENCEELHPRLVEAWDRYRDRIEFVAVGVGVAQSPRRMKRHMEGLTPPVEWPMLFDRGGHAVRAFLAPATSYIVIIDTDGKVVYTGIGGNQDIATAIRQLLDGTR